MSYPNPLCIVVVIIIVIVTFGCYFVVIMHVMFRVTIFSFIRTWLICPFIVFVPCSELSTTTSSILMFLVTFLFVSVVNVTFIL